ncbi:hypothetical protein GCM10011534_44460 [Pseudooceanicola nanhaiensis]|uniref:Uncharacterized protein n=1 Tax=Pseudooceanicola nanhaiensis TaxID=375761 RepID=A0A917TBW7_9RHOB|nr:hypothetical protein GCM10011534_44460 [Pseudooceanicola nanhaiensis]
MEKSSGPNGSGDINKPTKMGHLLSLGNQRNTYRALDGPQEPEKRPLSGHVLSFGSWDA